MIEKPQQILYKYTNIAWASYGKEGVMYEEST